MRVIRNVALIAMLFLSPFIGSPGEAGAWGVLWTYTYETFAVDLVPGSSVEVGFAGEYHDDDLPLRLRWVGTFGTLTVELERVLTTHFPEAELTLIPAEDIMAQCADGFLTVSDRVFREHPDGSETLVGSRDGIAPCNWGSSPMVVPIAPIQHGACGANNDTIELAPQSTGVALYADSGWVGHERTVDYRALPGYVLDGPGVFNFIDSPSALCAPVRTGPPAGIPTPPKPIPGVGNPGRPNPRPVPNASILPMG